MRALKANGDTFQDIDGSHDAGRTAWVGTRGASDQPTDVQKSNDPAAVTRILETRQATQPTAIGVLGSPAALARWVDEQRGRHVAVGLTIFR